MVAVIPSRGANRLKGRLPILHMKDYTVNTNNQATFAEIGNGNLDWRGLLPPRKRPAVSGSALSRYLSAIRRTR